MPTLRLTVESPESLSANPGMTIIYKHSPTCELSHWAAGEVARLATEDGVTIHEVDVLGQRPLSDAIASHFGVRHQSPQLLLIENGRVVWHASHSALTTARMRAALNGDRADPAARG